MSNYKTKSNTEPAKSSSIQGETNKNKSNNSNLTEDADVPKQDNSIETTGEERKSNLVFPDVVSKPSKTFSTCKKVAAGNKVLRKLRSASKKIIHFQNKNITLTEDTFGYLNLEDSNIPIKRFTWKNHNAVEAQIITYGARIASLKIPDKQGYAEDIVLGFDNLSGYVEYDHFMFGATIGRVTGPVENSTFVIDGKQYWLKSNVEQHSVNGGDESLHTVVWNAAVNKTKVILSHLSPDNHEGFPGEVLIAVTFELSTKNEFSVHMEAISTKPTIINLSNLCYFNLSGHGGGHDQLYMHFVTINSNTYTKMDDNNFPTGEISDSAFTKFDFQVPVLLRRCMGFDRNDGFNQNFCIRRDNDDNDVRFVARALHIPSGRVLEMYSNQYGVRFVTTNDFGEPSSLQSLIMSSAFKDWNLLQRTDSSALTYTQQEILLLLLDIYQKMKEITEVNRDNFQELLDLFIKIYICNLDQVKVVFVSTTVFKQANIDVKVIVTAVIKCLQLIKKDIPSNITSITKWEELKSVVGPILDTFRTLNNAVKTFTHKVSVTFSQKEITDTKLEEILSELQRTLNESVPSFETSRLAPRIKQKSEKSMDTPTNESVNEEWIKEQLQSRLFKEISEHLRKITSRFMQSVSSRRMSILKENSESRGNLRILGKDDYVYSRHCGMAFQTQNYPNAIYHTNFPNCILKPNDIYSHKIVYKFWVQSGNPSRWLNREFS